MKQSENQYSDISDYCAKAGYRLARDPKEGYWLHFDGRMRYVRHLSEVRGTVDYIERYGVATI